MSLGIQAWILARSLAGVLTRFWTRFLARLNARALPQFLARLLARRVARLWRRLCGRIDIASRRRGLVFHIGRRPAGFGLPHPPEPAVLRWAGCSRRWAAVAACQRTCGQLPPRPSGSILRARGV